MVDTDKAEQIRQRAHEIWEREGRPHGMHDDHWHRAAHEIAAEAGNMSEDEDRIPDAGGTGTDAAIIAPGGSTLPTGGTMPVGGTAAAGSSALATGISGGAAPGNTGSGGGTTGASPIGTKTPGVGAGLAGSVTDAVGGGGLAPTRATPVGGSAPNAGSGSATASQSSGAVNRSSTGSKSSTV